MWERRFEIIKFADNMTELMESEEKINRMIEITKVCKEYGMQINTKKRLTVR